MDAYPGDGERPNGTAIAAFLAAAIGAFSMGLFVILNETGLFAAPALYGPAGGVTGRTTLAVLIWLIAWWLLHRRWQRREVGARGAYLATLLLLGLGILLCTPPLGALAPW